VRRLVGVLTTAAFSVALMMGQLVPARADAADTAGGRDRWEPCVGKQQTVTVTADASGLHFSTTRISEGWVNFRASTTNDGSEVTLFRPRRGVSPAQVVGEVMSGLNSDDNEVRAASARAMKQHARFYGLTQVQPGAPATATVMLKAGSYFAAEFMYGRPAPTPTQLAVVSDHRHGRQPRHRHCAPRSDATIALQQENHISIRGDLPASGAVLVRNRSDAVQIAVLSPITAGTTETQVQAYFDGGAEGPWPFPRPGPSVGTDFLSPGKELVLTYDVTPGTYILASYMPDLHTGLPTAFLGMYRVVELG